MLCMVSSSKATGTSFTSSRAAPPCGSSSLSLPDALPISAVGYWPMTETERLVRETEQFINSRTFKEEFPEAGEDVKVMGDRKSTRLNSSHTVTSYAVFCLIKKGGQKKLIAAVGDSDALHGFIKQGDWNQLHLIARGATLRQLLSFPTRRSSDLGGRVLADDRDGALGPRDGAVHQFPDVQRGVPGGGRGRQSNGRSEEHTSELQSHSDIVCRLLLDKKRWAEEVDRRRWRLRCFAWFHQARRLEPASPHRARRHLAAAPLFPYPTLFRSRRSGTGR